MTSQFPSIGTVRWALAQAVQAPSVHNSQPWLWQVGDRSVELYANPELALTHTDPDSVT